MTGGQSWMNGFHLPSEVTEVQWYRTYIQRNQRIGSIQTFGTILTPNGLESALSCA